VVVTLKAPPLSAFGSKLAAARRSPYAKQLAAAQAQAERNVTALIPEARIRWRYRLVANGFAVVLPESKVDLLARVPGIAKVWSNVTYTSTARTASTATLGPQMIGADKLWGPGRSTAGNGIKIGIIDDGVDAGHAYFDAAGFAYPPGFPKGQRRYTTPKVIVQRTFPPPTPDWKYSGIPFDPAESFHATHVGGIAAGEYGTRAGSLVISGVAPKAYLATTRRSPSRRPTSVSTATQPRSRPRSRQPSPTGWT
jgi:subtilisin family serine protease